VGAIGRKIDSETCVDTGWPLAFVDVDVLLYEAPIPSSATWTWTAPGSSVRGVV
jgi:hypothetical protein